MTNEEFTRMMEQAIAHERSRIIWSRVAMLSAALAFCVACWAAVVYVAIGVLS